MTGLLVDPTRLRARATRAAGGDAFVAPLAASLAADLERVLDADLHVADRKARLTRAGGRCPVHGGEFAFDPFSPRAFWCGRCGRPYAGREHEEFWLYRYQLWLADRAVHAAALHAIGGDARHAAFAVRVLAEAADVYPRLPDRDNVLGPTRPFFSTYLESLWLLSLCVALDLLESTGAVADTLGGRVRDLVLAPGRALVASYPEGRSNRQAWNAAARLAASRLLDDQAAARDAVHGPDGIAAVLDAGLLDDGSWFEGDNYHQFAHRGLWYGVTMAARAGLALHPQLVARFDRGFAVPFVVAMPDATLPARRDAQFGVSLRQWRWAEWLELGRARLAEPAAETRLLCTWLHALYAPAPALAGRDTGRWRASGEAERNEAPTALTRADLGWKSLLLADPDPVGEPASAGSGATARSVLLAGQGLAILRGEGGRGAYASLDYGPPGGGHGHPDRLNVQLTPWVLDPGTGSYVDRSLHWYRSTLAHAAPLVDERSQPPVAGRLLGFDAAVAAGFEAVGAEAEIAPGVVARRWLVRGGSYLVDHLAWRGLGGRPLDLPIGGAILGGGDDADASTPGLDWRAVARRGAGGLEDGFDFLDRVEEAPLAGGAERLWLGARGLGDTVAERAPVTLCAPAGARLWRAVAPGAPGHPAGPMCVVRAYGDAGTITVVWHLAGSHTEGRPGPEGAFEVRLPGGGTDRHEPPPWEGGRGWTVGMERPGALPHAIQLAVGAGAAPAAPPVTQSAAADPPFDVPSPIPLAGDGAPFEFALTEAHYRRSEETWAAAGRPTARVALAVRDDQLHVDVAVHLGRPTTFVRPGTENPLDNERAAINGDGLQLHLGVAAGDRVEPVGGWLLVPVLPGPAVDVACTTAPDATADAVMPSATWAALPGGWRIAAALPLAPLRARAAALTAPPVATLAVLVNEMPPGRERRRGQLVLDAWADAGTGAAFVYLRGDRHDPARGLRLGLPPAP